MKRVGLITCRGIGGLDVEDGPLPDALRGVGLEPVTVAWDDPGVPWGAFSLAVFRSPWDYFLRHSEFLGWLDRASSVTVLHNPPGVVRWNSHKGYLLELASRGVPVVPTVLLPRGQRVNVAQVAAAQGWRDVVLKPAVAIGGFRTDRHPDVHAPSAQAHADALSRDVDGLLQPYQPAVTSSLERSLIFFDGRFSHAIDKHSVFDPAGRTQTLANGAARTKFSAAQPNPEDLALAEQALGAAPGTPLLYARVDMIRGSDGQLRLMELEAFEPSLYLRSFPHAAITFAKAIAARVR